MIPAPSSTWFTAPPHWHWLIILYFFVGGLAGGCYFLASTIDLFGRRQDRPLARLGYYVAFPCVLLSGLLLTIDLNRPLRFWHMLVERNTGQPMFKFWSPMSVGSWALLFFGLFSFISFLAALAEEDDAGWPAVRRLQERLRGMAPFSHPEAPSLLRRAIAVFGGSFGIFVAGYTGVLLAVTNRPIWSDTPLLGMLFIVSAASTSVAAMLMLAQRSRWTTPGVADLHRLDSWVILLEFLVLVAVVVSLGTAARAFLSSWGLLLALTVVVGMALPLAMWWRPEWLRGRSLTTPAALVLIGGFLLRVVIVLSSESV